MSGEPHRDAAPSGPIPRGHRQDLVLGLVHFVEPACIYRRGLFAPGGPGLIASSYPEPERVNLGADVDFAASVDLGKRYAFDEPGPPDLGTLKGSIRRANVKCVSRNLALEVKTGTLRRPVGEPSPGQTILPWYSEAGGSEVRHPVHVGAGLATAWGTDRRAGLATRVRFERRRRV